MTIAAKAGFAFLVLAWALPASVHAGSGGDGVLPPLTCAHTGAGTLYDVGPGLPHTSIGAVPWENLAAGDTVRIHWRAAPYREKILLRKQGTAAQPIVVCGVPGPGGELPVLDGENATTRPNMGYRPAGGAGEVRGLIHVSWGLDDSYGYKPRHLVIQGLHIRNAFHEYTFTASTGTAMSYNPNAAGIFVERGEHITVRGVTLAGNGNGFFVASGGEEQTLSRDIVLERSSLYGNGTVTTGADRHHNIYTEAVGMLLQYNYIGPLRAGSQGGALKDRSTGTVVRYNRIEDGARSIDLVEAQDSWPVVRDLPEYRRAFVYGNVLVSDPGGPTYMVHYGGDSGSEDTYRKGTLYFYNNTVVVRADQSGRYRTVLFDVSSNDETVDARNNIVFVRSQTPGAAPTNLSWMRSEGVLDLDVNWASPTVAQWRDGITPTGTISGLAKVLSNAGNTPGFVSEAGGNFAPLATSPAVDAGADLHTVPLALDHPVAAEYLAPASGRPRPVDGPLDLGAFELGGSSGNHPLQYLGKGPSAYDNGQIEPCSGPVVGSTAVLCVRAGATPGGNGTAAAPFASIDTAIAAAKAGDIVQVAAGSYAENVRLGAFDGPTGKDLNLLGGFSPDFAARDAGVHHSVIDGGLLDPAVQLHLDSAGATVLDGFKITGGRGLGSDYSDGYGNGGGVYVQRYGNGQTVVSHNEVYGNETANYEDADTRGGGIHAYAQNYDGATGTVRIEDNLVRDNLAGKGAGINVAGRQATVLRNRIENNVGHNDHGGGLYVSTQTTDVRDNVIRSNTIGTSVGYGYGGGVIVAGADADLRGNVVTDNYAPTTGAGVFWDEGAVGTMRNDLIFRNRCPSGNRSGAAIYIDGGLDYTNVPPTPIPSMVEIENATVADHVCPDTEPDGAAIVVEDLSMASIRNSILWGNSRDLSTLLDGSYTVAYSIAQEPGTGNLNQDPLFAAPGDDDYHLRSTAGRYTPGGWVTDAVSSPAIDAGDPTSDFSFETQPNGGRINLGAYGNTPEASRSSGGAGDRIFANGFE